MPSTIFALCETWLDPSIFDSHIIPLDLYTVFRRDRSSSRGGGVMRAIPSSFPCHRLCDLESDKLEALFVEITFNKKHLVACVYCLPAVRSESYEQLRHSVERMVSVVGKYHNILVLGDFNAQIDWHDPLSPTPQDLASDSLLDIMDTNRFTQLCTEPTYTSPAGSTSYLDLCFVSNPTLVRGCVVTLGLSSSDHRAILLDMFASFPTRGPHSRLVRSYAKLDMQHLQRLVSLTPWDIVLSEPTINGMYDLYTSLMCALTSDTVPEKRSRRRHHAPWITHELITLSRQKDKLFRRAKRTCHADDLLAAKQLQRSLKKQIRVAHRLFVEDIAARAIREPKLFWSYINSQRKQSQCPRFLIHDTMVSSPSCISEAFNCHFSSVWSTYTVSPKPILSPTTAIPSAPSLSTVTMSTEDVLEAVSLIHPSQGPGPDGIHPLILKCTIQSMAPLLCRMFQRIIDTGTAPDAWKLARVTPVYKGHGAQASLLSSYRPIASTSTVCRTFERILNKKIRSHLDNNNFLSPAQHGFRQNRSCETALGVLVHTLSAHLDNRTPCELVQLDLSRAFDRLPHPSVLASVNAKGISGTVLAWLASFLDNRMQRVVYRGAKSASSVVRAGVLQGSVLGPTLFTMFIDSITDSLHCTPILYADDISLLQPIRNPSDYASLQSDLDQCYQWMQQHQLPINTQKSTTMTVTGLCRPRQPPPRLTVGQVEIRRVSSSVILGVEFDGRLSFSPHVQRTLAKSRRMLGFITRTLLNMPPNAFRSLYTALVLHILEYCSEIWFPHSVRLQSCLASVHRRAAYTFYSRSTPRARRLPYRQIRTVLLHHASWQPLASRMHGASVRLLCRILS